MKVEISYFLSKNSCNDPGGSKSMGNLLRLLFSIELFIFALIMVGCGGEKVVATTSPIDKSDFAIQKDSLPRNADNNYICDFSWEPNGSNYLITFPSAKVINTDDYNPILSHIPKEAIEFSYNFEEKRYFFQVAKIDFTKIDRKTKFEFTKNMHFEFPSDVDSILYAYYRIDFPSDTSAVMPDKPNIEESITLFARCWKDCRTEEHGMEIIIGSMGYTAWFDKQGNKKADFYGDKFGSGEITSDYKYVGGAVGGYYSDGGGFYRKTRIYIYGLREKKYLFHKLINFEEESKFSYWDKTDKFVFKDNKYKVFIDVLSRFAYKIDESKIDISKVKLVDKYGYHFKDGTSFLFDRDFVKIPMEKLATPYPSTNK